MSKILKKEPVLKRSDIIEMYDRSKLTMYDLLGIARDKQCHITIDIKPSGIVFKTREVIADVCYEKTQIQTDARISYTDAEVKLNRE